MKNKNYRLLSLLLAIPLFLTGCNGGGSSGQGGGSGGQQSGTQSGSQEPAVTGVTITKPSETTVLDGTSVSLKATVAGGQGVSQKVTWSSSDSSIATVTNGVVKFLKVAEEKTVTITAAAQADATKKDTVEFTVEHSPFDLKNSRGNPDTSCYLDDGTFIIDEPQDIALVYADVHDTRWYVEATIQVDAFDPDDAYPKFGIMASERDDGLWTHEQSHQLFYYVDTVAAAQSWSVMNVVTEDNDLVNWDWSHQISPAKAVPNVRKGEPFKMGLMRDGNKFYQFYGEVEDLTLKCVGAFEYNSFGDDANYVWVGGWKTAAVVSDPVWMVGDDINALYEIPEEISLKNNAEVLFCGDTYQIEVTTEGAWDRNKITFESSDPTIATVSEKGLITAASDKTGTATITVGLEGTELSAEFAVTVTDDLLYKVELDGEMNDAIWTELVKENLFLLKKNNNNYVKIYAAKNSRGVYMFMDYVVSELKVPSDPADSGKWWLYDNVEFRLADDAKVWSGQYWLSVMNGGSFVSVGSGEKPEEIFYKPLVVGEDELYHGAFELFIPYGDDRVTKDQATYACFGFNPKADWAQSYNWTAAINDSCINITANGFAHDGTSCHEGHAGDWIVDTPNTCGEDGTAHRYCFFCGKYETKVLPADPTAHQFDYEHANVKTPSTCTTHGVGDCECTVCHQTLETALPLDYSNHSDAAYPATHSHCEGCGVGSHLTNPAGDLYDRSGVGGPWGQSGWYDMGLYEGDFVFTFEFHMQGCCGSGNANGDSCWRTALPFVYKEGYAGDADGHFFRMDWCGYGGGNFVKDINDGAFPDGFNWDICREAYSNMDVKLVYTKVGATITLDWVWTCLATEGYFQGKTFEYHQGCKLIDPTAKVGIAIASEFTICTFTKAELTRA